MLKYHCKLIKEEKKANDDVRVTLKVDNICAKITAWRGGHFAKYFVCAAQLVHSQHNES